MAWSSFVCWLVILIRAGSSEVGARSPGAEVGIAARPGVGLLALSAGEVAGGAADSRGRPAGVQRGRPEGLYCWLPGWQASLGPASGASHHVWSPQWVVSRPTSTTAGHSESCESASAVCMRVQW
eukprot:scaffold43798_cov49-Phaeocystis_antarctica.AAC.3